MNGGNGGMETYMTIEEVAAYLKLAPQTIRKFILNKSIPYRKVQKSVRFRLSEIERWIDRGGGGCHRYKNDEREGDLFAGVEVERTGEGGTETAADGQAGKPAADETGEEKA
jgi:excisionase family DNA binding protein